MITDVRASKMYRLLHQGESVASVSRRLKMSQKTVRKYRDTDQLPSQTQRPERTYRTRQDPLAEFWSEIEGLLQQDSQLKPYAILDWLKQKYNPPQGEPLVTDSIRRSLERRVQRWKLQHGVEQDVKFPQVHHAGDVLAFDFVVMTEGKAITADDVLEVVVSKQQLPAPTALTVDAPDLSTFDCLLQHKEVYDDQETYPRRLAKLGRPKRPSR